MRKFAIFTLGCVALTGCTTLRPDLSFVAPEATAIDMNALAADAAHHLAATYPPAKTTFVVYPTASIRQDSATLAFSEALRVTGFGVVEAPRRADATAPFGVPVRYRITPFDAGILLRLEYQGIAASRFYRRGADGALMQSAPFTVREAAL